MNLILFLAIMTLVMSAFFSAAEIVLVTVNRIKLEHQKEEGSLRAAQILKMLERPDYLLSGILVGNNVANVSCAALTTLLLARGLSEIEGIGQYVPLLTSLIVTPLVLFFSEIVPKNVGRRYANQLVYLIDRPIRIFTYTLYPLLTVIQWITSGINRLFRLEEASGSVQVSREEFVHWMRKSVDSGKVDEDTEKMIQSTIEFRETTAREIMTPLTEVRAISAINCRVDDFLNYAKMNHFSKYPVYHDRIDSFIGYVNVYDVLSFGAAIEFPITDFIQPLDYVPNTLAVDKLFFRMQKNRQKIVAVVDEYGGCDGIVTIEDVMEELVGDIAQEHEEFQPMVVKLDENEYEVDASIDIDDLDDELGLDLKKGSYETLAGYLITAFERIPQEGDSFVIDELYFEVLEMDRLAITKVKLVLPEDANESLSELDSM